MLATQDETCPIQMLCAPSYRTYKKRRGSLVPACDTLIHCQGDCCGLRDVCRRSGDGQSGCDWRWSWSAATASATASATAEDLPEARDCQSQHEVLRDAPLLT